MAETYRYFDSDGVPLYGHGGRLSRLRDAKDVGIANQVEISPVKWPPQSLLEDILSRLKDAKDVAIVQCVCLAFYKAGKSVRTLRFDVLDSDHESARSLDPFLNPIRFSNEVFKTLRRTRRLVKLHIEVEPKLQEKTVSEDEKQRTDFWFAAPYLWYTYDDHWASSLQSLLIADYGKQSKTRKSEIICHLAMRCGKTLKNLDLAHMNLDADIIKEHDRIFGFSPHVRMPCMVNLSLRSVKVTGGSLNFISYLMPNLQRLVLHGVSGVEGGSNLRLSDLRVLHLGLSTRANDFTMDVPRLQELTLRMPCPQNLIINAPTLKLLAINMFVPEDSHVVLNTEIGLEELMYRTSTFSALRNLNYRTLKRIYLDIPHDRHGIPVITDSPVDRIVEDFSQFHECEALDTLIIGPGLWKSCELGMVTLEAMEKLPSTSTLILYVTLVELNPMWRLLKMLLRPSVEVLQIYYSSTTPDMVKNAVDSFYADCVHGIDIKISPFSGKLDLSCFSSFEEQLIF